MPNNSHNGKVIHVVPDIHHRIQLDACSGTVFFEGRFFVSHTMNAGGLQFSGSRGDNRMFFRGKDQRRNSFLAKEVERQTIRPVAEDGFVSIVENKDPVVGQHAVKVENDKANIDLFFFIMTQGDKSYCSKGG